MRYLVPPSTNLEAPRWLCGCGHEAPYSDERGFPICPECGSRMRWVDSPELPFVHDRPRLYCPAVHGGVHRVLPDEIDRYVIHWSSGDPQGISMCRSCALVVLSTISRTAWLEAL